MTEPVVITVLEHDPSDPPLLLTGWLEEKGVVLDLRRLHAGDELPDITTVQGLISLGGDMAAWEDEVASWLPATLMVVPSAI